MKSCPSCGLQPTAQLEIKLDPIVCFSAKLKCSNCELNGPIFNEIESKSVKDLIQPAIELWNSWCNDFISQKKGVGKESASLSEAISDWLKENDI